jgi:hypothetical protein
LAALMTNLAWLKFMFGGEIPYLAMV